MRSACPPQGNCRRALPVLRSLGTQDEGWMPYARFREGFVFLALEIYLRYALCAMPYARF